MMAERILVVDDEPQILRFLRPALLAAGYDVISATTGADALKLAATQSPSVVLLDLGLPDMDGKQVIVELTKWSQTPIVVLSARDRESEKIDALDLGASDYVNKPFAMGELLARIRVALRGRQQGDTVPAALRIGDLSIDSVRHEVRRGEHPIKLTKKEFELLLVLARHAGRVLTHRQILTAVWGPAHTEDVQYLRVLVGQLRHKIESKPNEPDLIQTEPGIGYRLSDAEQ